MNFQLPAEYISVAQQYAQEQPQPAAPQRRPQSAYARQQQALQQSYYNFRKPTVVPPRPRAQLHPQALAQAEAAAEVQAQVDAQNRAEALRLARLGPGPSSPIGYEGSSYAQPKLGTFEQELLQLVSANQAQEFKLIPTQPKGSSSAYSQQLASYPAQYAKPAAAPSQLPEQYHIETSPPRYQQQQVVAYQPVEEPIQYQPVQPAKAFVPSPQYDYLDEEQKAYDQAHAQAQAQAQARAQAQAIAFQKVVQAAYKKHYQGALDLSRDTIQAQKEHESALEQIQQGSQVSDAGRSHLQEQYLPKNAEAAYKAKLKAQATAETAEARKFQQTADIKAHADAIRKLEAQQQAHLRVQEEAHNYALNFEEHQARAQAQAQAQAEALYKHQLQAHNQANKEIVAISKDRQGKKNDNPIYRYNLSPASSFPSPNAYLTTEQLQKYHDSGSSHVPRSAPKLDDAGAIEAAQAQLHPVITQPRQAHKLKIPSSAQAVYVSDSGLLKKSPIKSLTIEEVIEPEQNNRPVVQTAAPKGRTLSEEDLSALINAGYTVTPVPLNTKPAQQIYALEGAPAGYYAKKQKAPALRPDYATYEDAIQRPRKLVRKNVSILKQDEREDAASEKVTYLVPLEPSFGTRQPPLKHEE